MQSKRLLDILAKCGNFTAKSVMAVSFRGHQGSLNGWIYCQGIYVTLSTTCQLFIAPSLTGKGFPITTVQKGWLSVQVSCIGRVREWRWIGIQNLSENLQSASRWSRPEKLHSINLRARITATVKIKSRIFQSLILQGKCCTHLFTEI